MRSLDCTFPPTIRTSQLRERSTFVYCRTTDVTFAPPRDTAHLAEAISKPAPACAVPEQNEEKRNKNRRTGSEIRTISASVKSAKETASAHCGRTHSTTC